jgi:hypothetical protein
MTCQLMLTPLILLTGMRPSSLIAPAPQRRYAKHRSKSTLIGATKDAVARHFDASPGEPLTVLA